MRRIDLGGCPVDAATRSELLDHLVAGVRAGRPQHHVSLNAAKWVAMRHDETLRRAVREATSVAADGMAVVRAGGLPERLPGIEVAEELLERAVSERWRVALLGAREEAVGAVRDRWTRRGVAVVWARDGWFRPDQERSLARALRQSEPHLVLLALGTPKAEHFAWRWGPELGPALVQGVGGAFDVWAGVSTRAPRAVGEAGLEWAWRLAGAPRQRFRRAVLDSASFTLAMSRGERLP